MRRKKTNNKYTAAKTTISIYFVAYCLAINPACQFIYTSFSQDLLNDNSRRLANILTSQLFKNMYLINSFEEDENVDVVDDFWSEYLKKNNEFKITSKKITTKAGGVVLFASIGSQITGFGFGDKNREGFNGCLIIDDGNKPATIRSKRIREKTFQYYKETLLTRANSSIAPIINIQQRLHIGDLTGLLIKTYNFSILKKSLIENEKIILEKQYTKERIEELKKDNYTWTSQYQQEPIKEGGNIIKSEWFKYYNILPKLDNYYIVCDTALKTGKQNDYTVFSLWGIKRLENGVYYYIIDVVREKFEVPDLEINLIKFFNKYKEFYKIMGIYIEDKASGIGLIQSLRRKGLPIKELKAEKDKFKRVNDILPSIYSGFLFLPEVSNFNDCLINECEQFTADDSHLHDDIVDCISYAMGEQIFKKKLIKDIL